ncbi:MAG TPA: tetratricopeptide repeat protein [Methylomirabilota bacterium]|nr:tetratricopeptide repeat protein [Methylomirabilota bacterium]
MRGRTFTLAGLLLLAAAAPAGAEMTPTPPPSRLPPAPSAEGEYARGVAATRAKEWSVAAAAFSRAVEMKAAYPEAWNGLGFALRNQGKYAESLKAYDEALRLRPDYPEALEYLGEAYVKMGRLEDARRVLERLTPLDRERARELSEAIARGK